MLIYFASYSPLATIAPAGAKLNITTNRQEVAALIIEEHAEACDASRRGLFENYAKGNFRSWHDHMQEQGLVVQLSDMVFVTGFLLTGRWKTAVVRETHSGVQAGAGFLTNVLSASVVARFSKERTFDVPLRIGPMPPSTQGRNQCIFLRGYRFVER